MASTTDGCCLNDPNFAVICSFISNFGDKLILPEISVEDLQESIEDTKAASDLLVDLHVHLLRRIGKKVTTEKWQRSVVKFCHYFNNDDAWEIEQLGYEKAKVSTKLKVLKNLLETQFDLNLRFKEKISELGPTQLRLQPLGRDINGGSYWYLIDKEYNLRIYREEHPTLKEEDEVWKVICRDRDELAALVASLDAEINIKTEDDEVQDPKMEEGVKEEGSETEEKMIVKGEESSRQNELGKESDSKSIVTDKIASTESFPVKKLEIKEEPESASAKTSAEISSSKRKETDVGAPTKPVIGEGGVKVEPADDIPKSTDPSKRPAESAENSKKKEERATTASEGPNKTTSESNNDKSLETEERDEIKKGNTDSTNESKAEKRKLEFSEETEIESKSRKECSDNILSGSNKTLASNCKSEKSSDPAPKEVETTAANFRRESVIKIGKRVDKITAAEESAKQSPCENKEKLPQNKLAVPIKQEKEMTEKDVVVIPDTDKGIKSQDVTKITDEMNKAREKASLEMNINSQYPVDEYFDDKIVLMKEYSKDLCKEPVPTPAVVTTKPALASEEKVQGPHDVKAMSAVKTSTSDKTPAEAKKSILEENVNKLHSVGDCAENKLPKKCNLEKTEKAGSLVHTDGQSANNETRDNCKVLNLSKKENKFQNNDTGILKASEDKQKEINIEKKLGHKTSNLDKESPNDDKQVNVEKLPSSKKTVKFELNPVSCDQDLKIEHKSQSSDKELNAKSKSHKSEEKPSAGSKPCGSEEKPIAGSKSSGKGLGTDKTSCGNDKELDADGKSRGSEKDLGASKKSCGSEEQSGAGKKSCSGEKEPSAKKESCGSKEELGSKKKSCVDDPSAKAGKESCSSKEDPEAKKKSSSSEKEPSAGKESCGRKEEPGAKKEEPEAKKKLSSCKEEPSARKESHSKKEDPEAKKKSSGSEKDLSAAKESCGKKEVPEAKKKSSSSEEKPGAGKESCGKKEDPEAKKKSSGSEEGPGAGKESRGSKEEPAAGKKSCGSKEEPSAKKESSGSKEDPETKKKSSSSEKEPSTGKESCGKKEEPEAKKKSCGSEEKPSAGKESSGSKKDLEAKKKSLGSEEEPSARKESGGNEKEPGKKSCGNVEVPSAGKKSRVSEEEEEQGTSSKSKDSDKLLDIEKESSNKDNLKTPNDCKVVNKQLQDEPKTEASLEKEGQKTTPPPDEVIAKNTDDQHHSENLYKLKASLDKIQTTVNEEIAAGNEEKKLTCKIVIKRKPCRQKDSASGVDEADDDSDKMAKDTEDDVEYKCELSSATADDDKAQENEKNDCAQRVRKRKACDKLPVTPSPKNDRKTADNLGNKESLEQNPDNDKDELLQDENRNSGKKELDSKEGFSDTDESNQRASRRLRTRKTRPSDLEKAKTESSKEAGTTQGNSGQNADPDNEALSTRKTRSRRRTQAELICTDLIIPEEEKRTRGRKRQNTVAEEFILGESLEEVEPKKSKGSKNFRKTNRLKDTEEQFSSQSDSDDMPLSKMTKTTGRGRARGRGRSKSSRQPFTVLGEPTGVTRKSSRSSKKKEFNSNDFDPSHVRSSQGTGRSPRGGSATASKGSRGRQRKKRSGSLDSDKWVSDKTEGEEEEEDDDEEEEEEELFVGELLRRSSRVRSLSTKNKLLCVTSSDEEKSESKDDTSDEEFQIPKGRNARRAAARSAGTKEAQKIEENENDKPCCHCQKFDRPETILLCDKCDAGYHTLCLTPPLHIIPEGDWFCPPCEHKMLLEKLLTNLHELDTQLKKRDRLIKRKERLAFVGISLDNILSEKKENLEPNVDCPNQPVSTTRTCRARRSINYKFTEFDELIDSAIQDDPRTVIIPEGMEGTEGATEENDDDSSQNGKDISNCTEGPVSLGKDMDTIMNVYSETNDLRPQGIQAKKEAGRRRGKDISNLVGRGSDSDEQYPAPRKRRPKRKLTTLDSDSCASESDEYKASEDSDVSADADASEYSVEEEDEDDDDDEDYGFRRRSSRTSTRQNYRASRNSRRGTRRSRRQNIDGFVVDDDYDSDESANYRRSTRASVKRKVNYRERASDEEEEMTPTEESEESSAEFSGLGSDDSIKPSKKLKLKLAKKKSRIIRESLSEDDDKSSKSSDTDKNEKKTTRKRRLAVSDSESSSSGPSESGTRRSRRATTQKRNVKKLLDSDSEEESDKVEERRKTATKQKKKAILSDSDDSISSDDKSSIKGVALDKKDNDSKLSQDDEDDDDNDDGGAANDDIATTVTTTAASTTTPSTSTTITTTTTTNNNNSNKELLKEGQQNEDKSVDSSFSQMNGHDSEKKDKKETHLDKTENRTIATEQKQEDNCNKDNTKDDTSKLGTSTSRSEPQVLP